MIGFEILIGKIQSKQTKELKKVDETTKMPKQILNIIFALHFVVWNHCMLVWDADIITNYIWKLKQGKAFYKILDLLFQIYKNEEKRSSLRQTLPKLEMKELRRVSTISQVNEIFSKLIVIFFFDIQMMMKESSLSGFD